jgi:hypothetical protein
VTIVILRLSPSYRTMIACGHPRPSSLHMITFESCRSAARLFRPSSTADSWKDTRATSWSGASHQTAPTTISRAFPSATQETALAKPASLSICLLYVICRRALAKSRDQLSEELTRGVKQQYGWANLTVTARDICPNMPSLQHLINRGDVCESCALRWIERKLDWRLGRMNHQYSSRDLEIIDKYLAIMGKSATQSSE